MARRGSLLTAASCAPNIGAHWERWRHDLNLLAFMWGGVAGSALLLGSFIGYFLNVSKKTSALIMAFGVGVLIACIGFNLMPEAMHLGGLKPTVIGFLLGGALFGTANAILSRLGSQDRKRSNPKGAGAAMGSIAIALGALLDGIPESAAIGTSLLDGKGVALVTVLAVFVSNIPEGLASTVGMKSAGMSARSIFSIWGGITACCMVSAWLGYAVIGALGPFYVALAVASAAGAVLVMIIDTMIPEAFEELHDVSGLATALGFIATFVATAMLTAH